MALDISIIVPTHAPHAGRLQRTLEGLRAQSLPSARWETIVVDNASPRTVDFNALRKFSPANLRGLRELTPGLTFARRAGLRAARGRFVVMVDDDNVLADDYLAKVIALFEFNPRVGALGGRSVPEFEAPPPKWMREFDGLIACRDLGPSVRISQGLRPEGATNNIYPEFAPIGAGMALRREAVMPWMEAKDSVVTDRRGGELTSGGDNDIVLTVMEHGWEVGYFPTLSLTHLIPSSRTEPGYLARLNRGIAKSWVQVLAAHGACSWAPIPPSTVALRKFKAWWTYRAWSSPAARIRWQGACGHFEGLASLAPSSPRG
jgi:glycosyltransferase involved in cell wall biosynthesis